MTFYEAAIEVLRRSGRPLHYKKITEVAISENLLSHVGKTPEVTMSARLNQEVKRGEHASAILCKRPGIFALSDEAADRLNAEAQLREAAEAEARAAEEAERAAAEAERAAAGEDSEVEEEVQAAEEATEAPRRGARRRRRRRDDAQPEAEAAAPRAEAQREEDSEASDDEDESRGRGRRRRRRGRGRRRRDDGQQEASSEQAAPEAKKARPEPKPAEAAPAPAPERHTRKNDRAESRKADTPAKKQERRPRQQPQPQQASPQELPDEHLNTGPVRLEGIAEAAYTVLRERADQSGVAIAELANTIFERKLVRFHTHDATMTVQAAMVNDNQLREGRGHRPLFVRHSPSRWGLSEWGLTAGMIAKEQQILSLSEECRKEAISLLGQKLLGVQAEALEHVTLTLLERLGYRNIKVSKRGGDGDVFFSADWRQGLSDVRVSIQIVGDNTRTIDASAVTELRGTLHHYAASEGVIIHFGEIAQEAVQESREEKLATITLIDRATYVSLLVEQGIGVKRYHTPILVIDTSYVEALRGEEG